MTTTQPFVVVYDDTNRARGFILARRKGEFEAFTSDERSLGLFRSQVEAADAIHASDTKEQAR